MIDNQLYIKNLTVGWGRREVLKDISVEIPAGTFVVLVGRNGSGKSTLLRTLAGLLKPLRGTVEWDGREISKMPAGERSRIISLVTTEKVRISGLNCHDLVAMGRAPYTGWSGSLSEADETAIEEALRAVGMENFADRMLGSMSDGECQMVSIARAIAQDTPIMLLDEPTAFLDWHNRQKTFEILKQLTTSSRLTSSSTGAKTIICSTHDLEQATKLADMVLTAESAGIQLIRGNETQLT